MISVHFQGKPSNITVIQVYFSSTAVEDVEADQFYEDLPTILSRTDTKKKKKEVLFITGGWNAKVGSQEIPGIIGKFGLGVQNGAGQRLIVLSRGYIGHSKHPFPTTQEVTTHRYLQMINTKIRLSIFFAAKDGEALYSQQKQDRELTVTQIMNLLQNSD